MFTVYTLFHASRMIPGLQRKDNVCDVSVRVGSELGRDRLSKAMRNGEIGKRKMGFWGTGGQGDTDHHHRVAWKFGLPPVKTRL